MVKKGTSSFMSELRRALVSLAVFTVLLGIIYPVAVTGVAQTVFRHRANGSLVEDNGQMLGSELIGQPFSDPGYFWGRLSATAPFPYNAAASSGSNLGPTNPALGLAIKARMDALIAFDPDNREPVPVDLVTFSASGLDPHISLAAANYQLARVARFSGLSQEQVRTLVDTYTEGRQFGFLGEPRVNVLQLNLALHSMK